MARKPKEESVSYFSLCSHPEQWARTFTNKKDCEEFKNSPDDPSLQIGILLNIWQELRQIKWNTSLLKNINAQKIAHQIHLLCSNTNSGKHEWQKRNMRIICVWCGIAKNK